MGKINIKDTGAVLQSAVQVLLRPIVRFSLRRGLRSQEIVSMIKRVVFDVVREDLEQSGHKTNVSRLALLSGLQRKEVRTFLDAGDNKKENVNLVARIIGQWQNHPDYVFPDGSPKELSFEGSDSQFAELVRSVSADVSPYTVLFALEQSGAAIRDGSAVRLIHKVYDPKGDTLAGLEMLAQDTALLMKAVERNLFEKSAIPNLHITTFFDNISIDDVEALREWILDAGTTFHEKARAHLAKHDKDTNPRLYNKRGGAKVTLCSFSLVESSRDGEISG